MKKTIMKELFETIFVTIAVLLILSILFYIFMPSTKRISKIAEKYSLPVEMQVELEHINETSTDIVKTYKVDSNDLVEYEESNDYKKGRINPFATSTTNETNSTSEN